MKRLLLLTILLFVASIASAQTTTVTGTITDANGNAYANGTASALQVVAAGLPTAFPTTVPTNGSGAFSFSGSNALASPSSYQFTICATPVLLNQPNTNPTPVQVCFKSGPIAISGASQDISATLNAIAKSLGPTANFSTFAGVMNGNIAFGGNNTHSGTNTFTGAVTATGATQIKNLNSIRIADVYPGATCDLKVAAADADLGLASGQIWVSQICGTTFAAGFNLSAGHVLRFIQGGVYSLGGTIGLGQDSGILCDFPASNSNGTTPCAIKEANSVNLPAMISANGNYPVLRDLIIDGNKSNNPTGGVCIKINKALRGSINFVTQQNCATHGIWVLSTLPSGNESCCVKISNNFSTNNGGDGGLWQASADSFLEESEFENNGTTATVNTTNTLITATSGSWSTDVSLVGTMVRVNNATMCQVLGVPSITTLTVAATTCWNASGVPTGLGVQTGVPFNMGQGFEASDSPTTRFVNSDFAGNKMDGYLSYGTNLGLSSKNAEIGASSQFGNVQHDIEIIGSALDSQANANNFGNVIYDSVFLQSGFRTPGNTWDSIKLVDGGLNTISGNHFQTASSGANQNRAFVEQVESAGSRVLTGFTNAVSPNTLFGTIGTQAYIDSTVNGGFGMRVPTSVGGNLATTLSVCDTNTSDATPCLGIRVNSGIKQFLSNGGAVLLQLQEPGGFAQFSLIPAPASAGGFDLGGAALPWGNLWLGTAATNNFKFQPAATAAARTVSMPDPGTNVNLAFNLTATSAAFATATTAGTCVQNTTAVTGATTSMAVSVSPVSTPGVGAVWSGFVSSAGNVTINECAVAASAGGTIAFNIRVTP